MRVNYLNFTHQWKEERKKLLPIITNILESGDYVGVKAREVVKFEKRPKNFFSIICTVNGGTDALTLGMFGIGIKKGTRLSLLLIHI